MFSHLRAVYVYLGFLITLILMILAIYLRPKSQRNIRRKWANLQHYIVGHDIEVIGEPHPEANILLLNHQSMLDIVVLEAIHPADLAWVAKKEIEKIPLFGHILKAPKMISVERANKRSLLQLIVDVKDRVQKGRVIAMFPEGTRGKTDTLLNFKNGPKAISEKLNLNVQPAVIINTRHILDTKHFKARSGTVKVIYLDLIVPEKDTSWYEEMHDNMQKTYTKYADIR